MKSKRKNEDMEVDRKAHKDAILITSVIGATLCVALALFIVLIPLGAPLTKTPCPKSSIEAYAQYGLGNNWQVVTNEKIVLSHLSTDFLIPNEREMLTIPSDHTLMIGLSFEDEIRYVYSTKDLTELINTFSLPGEVTYTVSCDK